MRNVAVWARGVALLTTVLAGGVVPAAAADAIYGFSGWSLGYLPTAIAIDRLEEMGYDIEVVELGSNSNQLQAAATGAIQITALSQIMDAMDQGLDSRFFLELNSNEFLLVAKKELADCASLTGHSLGIQSAGSFVGQLAIQWLANTCPDAEPNITVIEGSDNRLAALLAGQLDSSVVDLQDWAQLQKVRPGEFVVTGDFTKELPIMRAAFAATRTFIAENEKLIEDWIRVHLDVYEDVYANPQLLIDKGAEVLGEVDPAVLPDVVQAFIDAKLWPTDGGLTAEGIDATIAFFNADGEPFENIKSAADIVDRTLLDKVLASR